MDFLVKEKTTQLVYDYFKSYKISKEQCAELAIFFKEIKLKRGAYFIEEGQVASYFGLITEGVMQNCITQTDGTPRVQYFLKERSIVSNSGSFDLQVPSKLSVQAITDCRLLVMDYATFQKMNERVSWFQRLMNPLSSIVLQNYLKEYADLLRMPQKERYKEFLIRNPDIIHRIPLKMIASYLGMSSQSLSRIRANTLNKLDNSTTV
jgi:CRP/FNR family transcriptional regulator, anaerobic regulatory protein